MTIQITVKTASAVLSSGTNDYGDWELRKFVGEDGNTYLCMKPEASVIQVGTVFEPDKIMLGEDKKGNETREFKKFKIVSSTKATSASPTPSANDKPDMSKDDWAEKDRLERWSRECNTCFMGIMELAGKPDLKIPADKIIQFDIVLNKALDWAERHFQATESKSTALKDETGKLLYATPREFKAASKNAFGFTEAQTDTAIEGFDLSTHEGQKQAWAMLEGVSEKKGE